MFVGFDTIKKEKHEVFASYYKNTIALSRLGYFILHFFFLRDVLSSTLIVLRTDIKLKRYMIHVTNTGSFPAMQLKEKNFHIFGF